MSKKEWPKLTELSCRYGAPMGRHGNGLPQNAPEKSVSLARLPMYGDNCYDKGGAYWGSGKTLWRAAWYDEDGESCELFTRAWTREEARVNLEFEKTQLIRN